MTDAEKIGKYTIKQVVGQGGMGKVCKAVSPENRFVIIKQLLISSANIEQRFKREASIMHTLRHPNIVPVYETFKLGKSNYIVMEFIDGLSLEDLIKRNRTIAPTPAMLIFLEACRGIRYAHDQGVIHRDIKPDNVLLSKKGAVKIADFGIATALPDTGEELTKTGMVLGTPAYMSPEQIQDAKHVEARTDIYSLGVLLYQMLTGSLPYGTTMNTATIRKICSGECEPAENLNPAIPKIFLTCIKKTMNAKPSKRYNSVDKIIKLFTKPMQSYSNQNDISNAIASYIAGNRVADVFAGKDGSPAQIKIDQKLYKLKDRVTIGRDKENDIVIGGANSVSRKHAVIEKKADRYFITDVGSTNGTFLNNKKITANRMEPIKPGDTLKIGEKEAQLL